MNAVPFLDLRATHQEIEGELEAAVLRVVRSGYFVLGPEVESFESEFAEFVSARHAVGVGSGLDALVLALEAVGIKRGDEVIVPANTFIATWLAVSELGAVPTPVEPVPGTWNIDPEAIVRAISSRTRAIVPVHLYGQPCELAAIFAIAREHGLRVVEDAAQCHGARYRGQRIGGHSDAVCWSFYPGKNLGALGDGGAVTTNSDEVSDRIRLLRNYGSPRKYDHVIRGRNSRLDELQAAALRVKLRHLDRWNSRRREAATRYLQALHGVHGLDLPAWISDAEPAWHLFVINHPCRDALQEHLRSRGIQTSIHYPIPPHLTPAYAQLGIPAGTFPLAERAARTCLSLPMGPHLSIDMADVVVQALRDFNVSTLPHGDASSSETPSTSERHD